MLTHAHLQVVYQLGTVCCSLLQDVSPDSFSTVSAMRAELALYALDLLLGKAADTFCRDYSAEALLGGGFSNPLAVAVAEQLQQSGLLQKYPTHAQGAEPHCCAKQPPQQLPLQACDQSIQ